MRTSLEIQEVNDRKIWEEFNLAQDYPAYFQAWDWGEVMKMSGVPVFRFGFSKESQLLGIAQVFDIKAKRGHFLHLRQGPVLREWDRRTVGEILRFIRDFAQKRGASYVRVSPLVKEDNPVISYLKEIGLKEAPIHNVDAENRWVLDISQELEAILKSMRKTTRYLIRKGESENIKVTCSQADVDIEKFLKIYYETARSKKFVPHLLVKEEIEVFRKEDQSFVYLAEDKGEILGGAVINYYGSEAIYRHGATTSAGRNTPASYLIQWQAIKDAKEKGLRLYNFWGVSKEDDPKDPWFGLSQFKKGFGGERVDFIHAMDYPVSPKYWISFLIDYYTKLKKGY
jgi:lipid II:glycine glycyltransferase (peptidoglycan interpeptide bridge formation enzyme)